MGSVATALAVLELVGERQPVGVSEVARGLGLPKTTAHRMLRELGRLGWIRADEGDAPQWRLTTHVLSLAGQVAQESDLLRTAQPQMEHLNQVTGETIHLTVPEDVYVVLLSKIDSTKAVRAWSMIGGRAPVHASSSGKAVLAHLPDDEVGELLAGRLESFTERTTRDLDALRDELAVVRERGYALNLEEWRTDVASTGAAILDERQRPIGALSISMPAHRFGEELWHEYGELVAAAARAVTGASDARGPFASR